MRPNPREISMSIIAIILSYFVGYLVNWEIPKLLENETIIAYFLIAGVIGSLVYGFKPRVDKFFENHENNSDKLNHSKNDIAKALKIMSEGHYGEYLETNQFLIPYPFSEYKQDKRRMDFPTTTELIESFNKRDWSDTEPKKYEFVSFNHSPEAKFEWAMAHLESYDDIKKKFENAEKANQQCEDFCKKNKQQIDEHYKNLLARKEVNNPFHDKLMKILDESNKASTELQGSIRILYHKLERGKIIKGKCDICSEL